MLTDHIQQIRNHSENEDITEKPNCNLGFLQLLYIIFNLKLIILFISTYDVIRTPTNGSAVYWSRDTDRHVTRILHSISGSSAAYI